MPYYIYCWIYLIIINLTAMFVTIYDKHNAQRHRTRIPERTLLLLAALGGSITMLITMKQIHHKTRHKKFMVGIPIILTLQAASVFFLFQFLL